MVEAWQRKIAHERIEILFREAEENYPEHKERSNRYIQLARKIGMRYQVKIPKELKRKVCPHCHSYLKIGSNYTVRLKPKEKVVSYLCKECGKEKRYQYYKKT